MSKHKEIKIKIVLEDSEFVSASSSGLEGEITYLNSTALIDALMERFKHEVNLQHLCAKYAFNYLHAAGAKLILPTGEELLC